MSNFTWKKPTLSIYRENNLQPETEPFAVIKAQKLSISQAEDGGYGGAIEDFMRLMGDVDEIAPGKSYVVCWFDDSIEGFYEGFRRLSAVTFPSGVVSTADEHDKRTYNTVLQAKHAKLR